MSLKTKSLRYINELKNATILTVFFSFFVAGCLPDSGSDGGEVKSNQGRLELNIASKQSRTLEPDAELVADSFRVTGTGPNGKALDLTFTGGSSIQLDSMEIGDWNIIVEASNAQGYLFSRGSLDVTILPDFVVQETVVLTTIQDTGSFLLMVEVPDAMSATPYLVGSLQAEFLPDIPLTFTSSPGNPGYSNHTVLLDNTVPAGYYTLSVTVFDDENMLNDPSRYTGFADSVRILEGQTTSGSFTMNNAPGMEVTLNIEFDLNESIDVSILNAGTLPTSFAFNSTTQFMLTADIPVSDPNFGSFNYEWFVNGQSVDYVSQYEINSEGRLATSTVTRSVESPTLDIHDFVAGTAASLSSTATNLATVVGDFRTVVNGGQNAQIDFDIIVTDIYGSSVTFYISLHEAWLLSQGVADITAVTIGELNYAIEQQIITHPNSFVLNVNTLSNLIFTDGTGFNGGTIELIPNTDFSNIYDISDLGFAAGNRTNTGVADIEPNNSFNLDIIGFGSFDVTIPSANYASVADLAAAIDLEVDNFTGVGILDVEARNNKLVFINRQLGSAYSVVIGPSWTLTPDAGLAALADLKLDNLQVDLGVDADPFAPRYLPGPYTVDVIVTNLIGTRSGSTSFSFTVTSN